MGTLRAILTALLLAFALTGCGEYHGAAGEVYGTESAEPTSEGTPAFDTSMNDPDATPADELKQADLVSGEFEPLPGAPAGYDEVGGEAYLGQEASGTTVTIRLTGLQPDTAYTSHLHQQPCDQAAGGEHFAFDPEGEAAPPNEVHLGFTTGDDGSGEATVTNDQRVEDRAPSVVIHEADSGDKIACADLDTE